LVEEVLATRGIAVSHETIRQWGLKFGRQFASRIRRPLPRGDQWHLNEVALTMAGKRHWLWRAVDLHGFVLDVLAQSRRDRKAAGRLLRKLLKAQRLAPRTLVTDKLKSYATTKRNHNTAADFRSA
jgi:putative transposase